MTTSSDTLVENTLESTFRSLQSATHSLRKEEITKRKERLRKLRLWVHGNRPQIHEAMFNDFRKPAEEVDAIEVFHVLNEIKQALNNIDQWTADKKIDAPITMLGTRSFIRHEPRGVCLIISPWNYPFSLAVGPLVSAVAAGNAVIIKPSEMTPNVSAIVARMVKEVFTDGIVRVMEGGPEVSKQLLSLPFDHIFFTGSPAIGKIVMKAAAENLTSVTLELGGKSPVIVTDSASINDAAQRIAVAKFINNGQTCVAPDYILVNKKIEKAFTEKLISEIKIRFTTDGNFETSNSYCRIVNQRHFNRVNDLIQDAISQGATMVWGGNTDASTNFIHPMVFTNVPPSCKLMSEEIFGPVLPIVAYNTLGEALAFINSKPKALALYVFTKENQVRETVLRETSSGAVCINDCAIHFLHHHLPFGGVNNSGIGKSHGHYGFTAFSNEKPVLKQKSGMTSVRAFYPPYNARTRSLMDWFLKLF